MLTKYQPLVSVIINSYNGSAFINNSINSILNQTYKNYEIIFFDNCSTDSTQKELKKINSNKIKYFKSKKHVRLYHARDLAMNKVKGELITFLDVDDWWNKDKLKLQVNCFKDPKVVLSCTNFKIYNKIDNCIYKAFNKIPELSTNILLKKNYIGMCTLMFRKKNYHSLKKGFDHRYEIIGDYDLCLRISKDKKIAVLQRCLSNYRWHKNNLSNTKKELNFKELIFWTSKNSKFRKYENFKYLKQFAYFNLIITWILNNKKLKSLKYFTKVNFLNLILVTMLLFLPVSVFKILLKITRIISSLKRKYFYAA